MWPDESLLTKLPASLVFYRTAVNLTKPRSENKVGRRSVESTADPPPLPCTASKTQGDDESLGFFLNR